MSTVIATRTNTVLATIRSTIVSATKIPDDLFKNGEAGTFSDINTYATNYYSDDGVTPAELEDPIYRITDQSGNGLDWVQGTATARLILKQDGSGLYLAGDGGDDTMTTDGSLSAGSYKVYVPTREGIFIDTITHTGGPVSFGPTSYTGGPAGILTALETSGELRIVGPPLFVPAAGITSAKEAAIVQWFQNRGAGPELELGPELVVNGTFDTDVSGWGGNTGADLTYQSGAMRITGNGQIFEAQAYQSFSTTTGEWYVLLVDYIEEGPTSGRVKLVRAGNTAGSAGNLNATASSEIGSNHFIFKASGETTFITLGTTSGNFVDVDNISVRKLQSKGGA